VQFDSGGRFEVAERGFNFVPLILQLAEMPMPYRATLPVRSKPGAVHNVTVLVGINDGGDENVTAASASTPTPDTPRGG